MAISVKNYTNRFVAVVLLVVMAVWALLFYAVIMDEVYDNIDDGLKNQKILILREVYKEPKLIEDSKEYGVNQFIIRPLEGNGEEIDKNVFSKEMIYMPYDEEEEPYRVLRTGFYDTAGNPYLLEIRTSTVEEDDFLINLGISLLVLYVVIVLSILVVNYFVLQRAWQPFDKILKHLSRYRFGKADSFVAVPSAVKEFNDLNNHIQFMIQQNEKVFESQKLFLENASHELQTPLAVSINKLELVLENNALSEADLVKIVEAKRSMQRIVNLNKSLLTLSRINNQQYSENQEVNMNEVVEELLEDYHDLIVFKDIQLHKQDNGVLKVMANKELMSILVANLLSNAIKYNVQQGSLDIFIESGSLRILNTSTEGALNPDYIFERFYKGKQDSNSNGLGLSIVKSILENYPQFLLEYTYTMDKHQFSLVKREK